MRRLNLGCKIDWKVPALMLIALLAACFHIHAHAAAPAANAAALVVQDAVPLRAAPREAAPVHTLLWRGEALEIRGERGEYLQVWDHQRERGGYVRRGQLHLLPADTSALELLAVLGFVRDLPGAEPLGLAIGSSYVATASAEQLRGVGGAQALDAIGRLAERLAERASAPPSVRTQDQAALAAHLEVAARLGVKLQSRQTDAGDGRMLVCYDGDAWRRVLLMPVATPEQKARAALGLTRQDCADPSFTTPSAREQFDQWRAELLDQVPATGLNALWHNRLATRRTAVWSSLAFARSRRGDVEGAKAAAERALAELGEIEKSDLADDELTRFNEAALRANAMRWAATAAPAPTASPVRITTQATDDGQTCVELVDSRRRAGEPLARRCTWGLVWAASASLNREANALALAVQPTDGWRELWIFRRTAQGWTLQVLPPASAAPGLGYAEFAGWVPGGQQVLVAREAIAEGRTVRRFEVLKLDTLATERTAFDPAALGAFNRWQDAGWKRASLALR